MKEGKTQEPDVEGYPDEECGLSREERVLEKVVDKIRELPTLEAMGVLKKYASLPPSIKLTMLLPNYNRPIKYQKGKLMWKKITWKDYDGKVYCSMVYYYL